MSIHITGRVDFRSQGQATAVSGRLGNKDGIHFFRQGWSDAWISRDTPATHEATCFACGRSVLFGATGRIDNRSELDLPRDASNTLTDVDVLRRGYSIWGARCAEKFDGDWVIAGYCRGCRRLDLLRDVAGISQLFYAHTEGVIAFSTDIRVLARLHGVPQALDELWIAKFLVGCADKTESATAFRAICRLPPAHSLTADPVRTVLARYWSNENRPLLMLRGDREYAEVLRDTLTDAVTARIRGSGPIGSTLSAGLDSSAVTALAARELARRDQQLVALTHVPDVAGLSPPFDEGPAAAELVRALASVRHVLVRSDHWTPVRALRRYALTYGAPVFANTNAPQMCALLEEAQRLNLTSLLMGQVGNLTMDWGRAAATATDLIRAGRYRVAVGRAAPVWLRALRSARFRPTAIGESPWTGKPIRHTFADELDLRGQILAIKRNPRTLFGPRRSSAEVLLLMAGRSGSAYGQAAAESGVALPDPFVSKRLLELVASIPTRCWVGGQDRGLFRQAMIGVLPESTRLRPWKGVQSADFACRLASRPDEVSELLSEVESSSLAQRFVDLPWCRRIATDLMDRNAVEIAVRESASWLMLGLEMALFLSGIERGAWRPFGADGSTDE